VVVEGRETLGPAKLIPPGLVEVGTHHLLNQFLETDARRPAELRLRLGRIAEQGLDLGRTEVARVDPYNRLPLGQAIAWLVEALDGADFVDPLAFPAQVDAELGRGRINELSHAVLLTGGDDVVVRGLGLQHQPLHFDVITSVAPVAPGIHVSQVETVLQAEREARQGPGNLARDKGLAANR